MALQRKTMIAGNWKMNGLAESAAELEAVIQGLASRTLGATEMAICPPATLLFGFAERAVDSPLMIGGQDCHMAASGAHTGDISAEMLRDAGAALVLVGHSERRADYGESDAVVKDKAEAALRAGLRVIVCVGETLAERDAGRAAEVATAQLLESLPEGAAAETVAVAYEPVWAIGTGRVAETPDIAEMHSALRQSLASALGSEGAAAAQILYGGSVKPGNARDILALEDVDGALVGGASLKASDFLGILDAV